MSHFACKDKLIFESTKYFPWFLFGSFCGEQANAFEDAFLGINKHCVSLTEDVVTFCIRYAPEK